MKYQHQLSTVITSDLAQYPTASFPQKRATKRQCRAQLLQQCTDRICVKNAQCAGRNAYGKI